MLYTFISFVGFVASTLISHKFLKPAEVFIRGKNARIDECWVSAALALFLGVIGAKALPLFIFG